MKFGFDGNHPSTTRGLIGMFIAVIGAYLILSGKVTGDPITELILLGTGLQGFFGAATVESLDVQK
jgi:heme A synthase